MVVWVGWLLLITFEREVFDITIVGLFGLLLVVLRCVCGFVWFMVWV